jgi:DNA-directed RNA polymerase alpha subunit
MNSVDLVRLLRQAADEYERISIRNKKLDEEIDALRQKYKADVALIKATPSPQRVSAPPPPKPKEEPKKPPPPPTMPLFAIGGVSPRAYRALYRTGTIRVKDFNSLTLARLAKIKNCGSVTVAEIKGLASRCGYTLR